MFYDFLSRCRCVLADENADFQAVLRSIESTSSGVGFMPAIWDDWYPVFALSCTSAKRIVSPEIYLLPAGSYTDVSKPRFEELIDRFYRDDEFEEQFQLGLNEMILLKSPELCGRYSLYDGTEYNLAFIHLTLPDGTSRYLCIVPNSPDECWKTIIEAYQVKCEILIDSHKGVGGWLDTVPLYRIMRETDMAHLLPQYYFKGRYISHDVPPGFHLRYTIRDQLPELKGITDSFREIYGIDWNENRNESRKYSELNSAQGMEGREI